MGTDRDEIESGPCPCGMGAIRVDHCSPDHSWGGGSWLEAHLDCNNCSKDYSIRHNEKNQPSLVKNCDLATKKALERKWHDKIAEIEASAEFKILRSMLEAAVNTCKSKAAKHRLLCDAKIIHGSYQTYLKNPTYRLSGLNALDVAAALNLTSPNLTKMDVDLRKARDAMNIAIPAVSTGLKNLAN